MQRQAFPIEQLLRNLPKHQMPRERMENLGSTLLSNEELLAVLFGRGVRGHDALALAHSVTGYLAAISHPPTVNDLKRLHGIGPGKACQILAALELSRRYITRKIRIKISKPEDALPLLADLRGRRQECFIVLTLDSNHQVVKVHEITVGLVNRSQVHPRETFAVAIEDRAIGIIVAHNHPSGSLEASSDDLLTTRRLADAGQLLGIPLLDHLIVADEGFLSIREKFPNYFCNPPGFGSPQPADSRQNTIDRNASPAKSPT